MCRHTKLSRLVRGVVDHTATAGHPAQFHLRALIITEVCREHGRGAYHRHAGAIARCVRGIEQRLAATGRF